MTAPSLVEVRILRRPHALSPLMPGDRTYFTKEYAERVVAHGVAEFVNDSRRVEPAAEPAIQAVDPAVEVLGCPPAVRQKMTDHYRKKKR